MPMNGWIQVVMDLRMMAAMMMMMMTMMMMMMKVTIQMKWTPIKILLQTENLNYFFLIEKVYVNRLLE